MPEIITLRCVEAVCWILSLLGEDQLLNSSSLREKWFSKNRLSLVVGVQITILNINILDRLLLRCDCQVRDVAEEQMVAFSYSKQVDFGSSKSTVSSSADQSQKILTKVIFPRTVCVSIWLSEKETSHIFFCLCVPFSLHHAVCSSAGQGS